MTSPVPMMTGSLLDGSVGYFVNCLTDAEGYLERIKKFNTGGWKLKNNSDNQCFDVKLNYAKYNLYYQDIDVNKKTYLDNKTLYLINSLKMPISYCSDQYLKYFSRDVKKENFLYLYKQDKSEVFDDSFLKSNYYTCILFISSSLKSSPFVYKSSGSSYEIFPKKGSLIILPPGTEYKLNNILDEDNYYAVYEFSDII